MRASVPTGGMPTNENCLVWAEYRTWLSGMLTGRNADRAECRMVAIDVDDVNMMYWGMRLPPCPPLKYDHHSNYTIIVLSNILLYCTTLRLPVPSNCSSKS